MGRNQGDFCEYVALRRAALLRAAILLTRNKADAEDLLQAALAKTYLAWERINDPASVDGYVRRALINTHISWWRRRRVQEYPSAELPDTGVEDPTNLSELRDLVHRALRRLPDRQRAAVVLRYYADMSEPEIADTLGISIGTVKSTVSRGVAKLRADAELGAGYHLPRRCPCTAR